MIMNRAAGFARRATLAHRASLGVRTESPFISARRVLSASAASGEATKEEPTDDSSAEPNKEGGEGATDPDSPVETDYTAELEVRVAELEEELKSKHDQVLRALAEADNARRRAKIDVDNAHKFAVGKFAKELLDVADNLTRAQEAVPEEMRSADEHPQLKALYEGVSMTETVLLKTFEKQGLVKIWPMDEKFDPNFHDALFEMPDPTKEAGTIAHVANAGYVLNERCIRPAGVGVVKA